MTKNPLFSTYRQGENRVTSSMLAVFERIDLSLLGELLAVATGESSLQMVTFTNQPPGSGGSVPDARISGRFAYWFEVKTDRNALRGDQLQEHLVNLGSWGTAGDERLFVVTPDPTPPKVISGLEDRRVVWFNFAALSDAIDAALVDPAGTVSEHARFLLRELQALLVDDGLVSNDDVVVVAARHAYPEYLEVSAYICQAERAFRDGISHLGFYTEGAIQRHIAHILHREDNVPFTQAEVVQRHDGSDPDQRIGKLIADRLSPGWHDREGEVLQVFLLSGPDDPDTVRLSQPIANDTVTESGRPWAWTLGQRYVSLDRLTAPGLAMTSQLERR